MLCRDGRARVHTVPATTNSNRLTRFQLFLTYCHAAPHSAAAYTAAAMALARSGVPHAGTCSGSARGARVGHGVSAQVSKASADGSWCYGSRCKPQNKPVDSDGVSYSGLT